MSTDPTPTPAPTMTVEEEQEEKRQLVLSIVRQHCTVDSHCKGLAAIGRIIAAAEDAEAAVLECTMIAGGKTNYSYKVSATAPQKEGEGGEEEATSAAVFAKIGFDFALWNPDRSVYYDQQRIANEYTLMAQMADLTDDMIAEPYHLIDLDAHSKVIISEWVEDDEQWTEQFIDGTVDGRVVPKLAAALLTLHTVDDFDPTFNDNARPCLVSLFPQFKDIFAAMIASYHAGTSDPHDASIPFAVHTIGQDQYNRMMDRMEHDYMHTRDCLIHNDTICVNLLVERRRDNNGTQHEFGTKGSIHICDWEMAVAGPRGADLGKVICFPIACAICHAMNGNRAKAYHILETIEQFWDCYEEASLQHDPTTDMTKLYKQMLGWSTFMLYNVFYQLNIFHDVMPLDQVSAELDTQAKGTYAKIGLELMQVVYGDDNSDHNNTPAAASSTSSSSYPECKELFHTVMTTKMEELLAVGAAVKTDEEAQRKFSRRRSSLFRAASRRPGGRRVSVSEEIVANVQRRMSALQEQQQIEDEDKVY